MKFFVAFAALVAVAVASPLKRPTPLPENISIGPAIVDTGDVAIGPAIVDFPIPAPCDVGPIVPSPVVIGDLSPDQPAPLVQIIVNVNQAGLAPAPVDEIVGPKPDPVIIVDEVEEVPVVIDPVNVVDILPVVEIDPVNVVEISPVVDISPVQVVDITPVVDVDPVSVVDITPGVAPEPVHVVDNVVDGVLVHTPAIAPEPVHVVDNIVDGVLVHTPAIAPEPVHVVDNVVDGVLVSSPVVTPIHH